MPYTIRLRTEAFLAALRKARFFSDYSLAREMQVNRSTVTRVLAGQLQPGPAFIAGALTALAPLTFDDLFTIEKVPPATDTPATGRRRTTTRRPTPRRRNPAAGS
ncbi:transcriptional regulator [Saccharothrix lopnurensis]|uniref:Transcriptional regulator n=1 Tax=Saccharothrix lopnurensis TaxID=1670621 RepID=A0ABW1P995_9PSEU